MNICVLTGNLGNDPEITYSGEGNPISTFSLAFSSGKEKTSWIKVVSFNKTAQLCEKYLHKGARVGVTGILDQDKWKTEEGFTRSMHKLIANNIEFIKTDKKEDDLMQPEKNKVQEDDLPF